MKSISLKFILLVSIILNFVLLSAVVNQILNGCAEIPDGRIGVLNQDIEVGYFDGNKTIFTLPKGLVVREASASGAGWFEPFRFRIVVTSNNEKLVDYSEALEEAEGQNGEYYSADIRAVREVK